jgi:hypothetical protein
MLQPGIPTGSPRPRASEDAPWGAELEANMPRWTRRGERVLAEVVARNTGRLAWVPPAGTWPQLRLSYHVLSPAGQMLRFDGERVAMPPAPTFSNGIS